MKEEKVSGADQLVAWHAWKRKELILQEGMGGVGKDRGIERRRNTADLQCKNSERKRV